MFRILALTTEDTLILEIQEKFQDDHNAEVLHYSNSLDFLQNFQTRYTELVILDIDMLENELIKMINVLRTQNRNCQIILILSQSQMGICSKALSLGIVSYLIKPVSVDNIFNIICSVLQLSHDR